MQPNHKNGKPHSPPLRDPEFWALVVSAVASFGYLGSVIYVAVMLAPTAAVAPSMQGESSHAIVVALLTLRQKIFLLYRL